MSDEILNNNENEETAALFVSAQKKKKAEEQAQRKAAEEQARRDAAEAEVRRMEQEVEERKRKAEEERRALEEAEAAAREAEAAKANVVEKIKSSVNVDDIKEQVKKKTEEVSKKTEGKNNKLPMFIGIGAAAIVLIVVILVLALGKKGGKNVDFTELEFAATYEPQMDRYKIPVSYPESQYTEAKEQTRGSGIVIDFTTKGAVNTQIIMTDLNWDDGNSLKTADLYFLTAKQLVESLGNITRDQLKASYEGMSIMEEGSADVSAEDPGRYYYSCRFRVDDSTTGVAYTWITINDIKEYKAEIVICTAKEKEPDASLKMCDAFTEKNATNVLKIPGASAPESEDCNDMIRYMDAHIGIPVPTDRFEKVSLSGNGTDLYVDKNGAIIMVAGSPFGSDSSIEGITEHFDENMETIKGQVKDSSRGLVGVMNSGSVKKVEQRDFLDDHAYSADEMILAYRADFNDVVGGVQYWERTMEFVSIDETDGSLYLITISFLAPKRNKDVYESIFSKSLNGMVDIND